MPEQAGASGRPRVVVTRRAEQAAVLGDKLAAAGFQPLYFPTIELQALPSEALDHALADSEGYDWLLFSSGNAVRFYFERLQSLGLAARLPRTAVVGPATARKLREYGVEPDFMPETFTGEALAVGLGDLHGQRILLPRSRIGNPQIVDELRRQGATVADVPLYDTVTAAPDPAALDLLAQGYEAITFTSPSSVQGFVAISGGKPLASALVACIGPVTAEAAEACDIAVALVPAAYTLDGLVQVLADHFGEKEHE